LRRIFKIRNCRVQFAMRGNITIIDKVGKTLPCMDYYIWLCPAPCLLKKTYLDAHNASIAKLRKFLSGKNNEVIAMLEATMWDFSRNLDFEKADEIKQEIQALKNLSERQLARDILPGDHDFVILLEKYDQLYIWLLSIRWGNIMWIFRHTIQSKIDSVSEVLVAFLAREYSEREEDLPETLNLKIPLTDQAILSLLEQKNITLMVDPNGKKRELIQFLENQVREYAYKSELQKLEQKTLTREHMANVLERLGYMVPKKWEIVFECYDISHTHGQFTYASRVCIVNGKPDPTRYKKYKIKTLENGEIDDFASHREVMMRRMIEWIGQENLPHLIIIDWGKWQLSSAIAGIKEGIFVSSSWGKWNETEWNMETHNSEKSEYGVFSLLHWQLPPICSIAKREEEIFLPWKKDPILFQKGTPELMVLQKARDESHRFSITANRNARGKAMKKNILEELPGIWPVTRKKLLKLAGSIDDIKKLSKWELLSVLNQKQFETLRDHGIVDSWD
jgi:excinuclease ABC subunit C